MEYVYLLELEYDNNEEYREDRDYYNTILGVFDSLSGAKSALQKTFVEKYRGLAKKVECTENEEEYRLDFIITSSSDYPGGYTLSAYKVHLNTIF